MDFVLRAARVVTPEQELSPGAVAVRAGRIAEVGREVRAPPGVGLFELPGKTLLPGFVDVHVHGGGGFSLAGGDPEQLRAFARWAVRHGVTAFAPTIVCAQPEEAMSALAAAAEVGDVEGGARIAALNLEGPFVSPERRGALPPSWVCAPDAELLERFIGAARGRLRLITVAPEREGALALIGRAAEQGLRVALGHTDAGFEESLRAFEEGASHVTHAFNAMRPFHHREPGPVGAALRSGATVEVIADGVHLHPAVVQLLVAALGPERVALVSDAVSAAGLGAGEAVIGGQRARVEGGRVVLPDGTLAGSASTLAEAVRDVVRWTGASLCEVSRMASGTPSRLLGLEAETGALRAGLRADIVAVDEEMRVTHTWCGGRLVYRGG